MLTSSRKEVGMRSFQDRLNTLLQLGKIDMVGQNVPVTKMRISDRKFGKIFVATVASVEFRPIEPGSNMGSDSLRIVVNGVLPESGLPVIELREKDGKADWKIAFGNFQNTADLEIQFY